MDVEQTWRTITEDRLSLAGLLAGLTSRQWETPSLCTDWRVRDVAGHLAMLPHPPGPLTMGVAAVRARGSFHRMNQRMAVQHAQRDTDELVAELREHAASRTVPVVTNVSNVLFDLLVHGQDIAVPLGIDRPMDPEAARDGAQRVWTMGWPFRARRRLRGLRLVATDVEWQAGQGVPVQGPVRALLLALTGRPAALPDLSGDGVPLLAERLDPAGGARRRSRRG